MDKFWEYKKLKEMSKEQWESLCDGCGKCCLIRLDEENEIACTNVSCILLDTHTCRCINYSDRHSIVSECLNFDVSKVSAYTWLPKTCSYRLISENAPLPAWHHLITGDKHLVHKSGNSVQGRVISEDSVSDEDLVHHIVDWVDSSDM